LEAATVSWDLFFQSRDWWWYQLRIVAEVTIIKLSVPAEGDNYPGREGIISHAPALKIFFFVQSECSLPPGEVETGEYCLIQEIVEPSRWIMSEYNGILPLVVGAFRSIGFLIREQDAPATISVVNLWWDSLKFSIKNGLTGIVRPGWSVFGVRFWLWFDQAEELFGVGDGLGVGAFRGGRPDILPVIALDNRGLLDLDRALSGVPAQDDIIAVPGYGSLNGWCWGSIGDALGCGASESGDFVWWEGFIDDEETAEEQLMGEWSWGLIEHQDVRTSIVACE
jgi:hypothetical protein